MYPPESFISFPKMINQQNLISIDIFVTFNAKEILIEIMKLFIAINQLRRFTKVSENDSRNFYDKHLIEKGEWCLP